MAAFVTLLLTTKPRLALSFTAQNSGYLIMRGQMVRKPAQALFGKELVSVPCVGQARQKNESVNQESAVVKYSM